jgi:hypothetical protein
VKRRTILFGAILVVATVVITTISWHILSSANVFTPKHLVQVRYGPGWYSGTYGPGNTWIEITAISVVFIQGNSTIASCIATNQWENVTLPEGTYIVKLYDANSGVYLRQFEIYVVKDIQFEVKP